MKMRLRKCFAALTGAVMLGSALPMAPNLTTAFAADCAIDVGTTYQTIRGFGGINLPEWITQGDMTDAQVQKAFGNGDDELGFTILRIYVSDDSNAWSRAVPTAKRAQALGATVFASPWNPPASIRQNGGGGKYSLPSSNHGAYAQHLNSYVKYMEGQGINLYSVSVQNEPDYASEWTYWSNNDMVSFLANQGKNVTAGTKAKMMSPESFQYRKGFYNAILGNQQALANTDLFGTHFYGTQRNDMDFPALENSGKDIWMTEVYVPNSNADSADIWSQAIQVAENMHNGLVVGNLNAYVWWYIRRSYGPMKENGQISKRGYNMAQFSKWVRPGAVRLSTTEQPTSNVLCSSYLNEDGSIAIVAINKGSGNVNQNFTISGSSIKSLTGYRTSSSENIKSLGDLSHNDSSFTATLPASSVTTYVIGATPPKPIEPDADGYFFHDTFESGTDGWSGRGGSTAVTAKTGVAYEGNGSAAVTDRGNNWNGVVKSLPASTFKAGTAYSFSTDVMYDTGSSASQTFHLTLEYKDASGTTTYDKIATETVNKGEWVQLANKSYTIPEGATGLQIYVETESGTDSFYIDEAIGAPEGTVVSGPKATKFLLGDLDGDEKITVKDMTLVKRGLLKDSFTAVAKRAADVNSDGDVTIADLVWYVKYLTGQVDDFEKVEVQQPATGATRTITEYTAAVKGELSEFETNDSKQKKNGVTYPQVVKKQYFSKKANKNRNYNIMLPANYDESKKYPVLYILHGFFENEDRMILTGNDPPIPTPQIITNAIAEGAAKEMIVVVPWVFTHPTKADATGFGDPESSAGYDNFVDDIVDSLMPHIESTYAAATGKANTAVTGFSMGGRESLLIGFKYPDKFGYIGAICPAPGVSGSWKWASEEAAPYLLLLTAGSNDTVVQQGPSGYHNSLNQAGTPHIWHYVNGGYHGDNCIRAHIYNFVRWIFKA